MKCVVCTHTHTKTELAKRGSVKKPSDVNKNEVTVFNQVNVFIKLL